MCNERRMSVCVCVQNVISPICVCMTHDACHGRFGPTSHRCNMTSFGDALHETFVECKDYIHDYQWC
jgi:hypothetical protein